MGCSLKEGDAHSGCFDLSWVYYCEKWRRKGRSTSTWLGKKKIHVVDLAGFEIDVSSDVNVSCAARAPDFLHPGEQRLIEIRAGRSQTVSLEAVMQRHGLES